MRKILHIIAVLTGVSLFSGLALVSVYRFALPLIAQNEKKATETAVFNIFPETALYEKIKCGDEEIYLARDKAGKEIGYAFMASGNGYQGEITLMAGASPALDEIRGIEILKSQETPGLGQEITNDKFRGQFGGLKTIPQIVCVKGRAVSGNNEIEAITGATISSNAVVAILNRQIDIIKKQIRE